MGPAHGTTLPGRHRAWPLIAALAAVLLLPAAALGAPVNTSLPELNLLGEGGPDAAECQSGQWQWGTGTRNVRFEWVLDLGLPSVGVVRDHAVVGQDSPIDHFTPAPAHVNHTLHCRVTATDDSGSATVVVTGNPSVVSPLVKVTVNSGTVSGDVGGGLSGANTVQVTLRRDGPDGTPRVVDQSPATTIDNTTGQWTATLPQRAVADDRDTLVLDFTGAGPAPGSSGVPPDTVLTPRLSAVSLEMSPLGQVLSIKVPSCGESGSCPRAAVQAPPALQPVTVDVADTPDPGPFGRGGFTATFNGLATNEDLITAELFGIWPATDGPGFQPVFLSITKTAPMLGVPEAFGEERAAPKCLALYSGTDNAPAVSSARCYDVAAEAAYHVVHSRGGIPLATHAVTPGPGEDALTVELGTSLVAGDVITLRLQGGTRTLAQLTVAPLRVDVNESDDGWTSVFGQCAAGRWIGGGDGRALCLPTGADGNETHEKALATRLGLDAVVLEDDLAGGGTAVSVPHVGVPTVPGLGESVWASSWKARAYSNEMAFPWSTQGSPITFAYRFFIDPLSVLPWATPPGIANSADGVTVSGLAPGIYEARWTITDRFGDTRTAFTNFMQQPVPEVPTVIAGQPGAPGAAGPVGPAGAQGPRGATGAAGRNARVTCTVKRVKTTTRVTCVVRLLPVAKAATSVQLRLTRGAHVVARGVARVRAGRAVVRMITPRELSPGSVVSTLVTTRKGSAPLSSASRIVLR